MPLDAEIVTLNGTPTVPCVVPDVPGGPECANAGGVRVWKEDVPLVTVIPLPVTFAQ